MLIAVFLAVTLIPSVEWIGDAWAHSPIDAAGPYFAALAVAW